MEFSFTPSLAPRRASCGWLRRTVPLNVVRAIAALFVGVLRPLALKALATLLFAALALGSAARVSAQILNPSFETPALTLGQNTFEGIPDWSVSGTPVGVWYPAAGFFNTPVPDGNQIGYTNGNTAVAQQLGTTLLPGSYTFSARIGQRNDTATGTLALELWAGGTVTTGNVIGGTLLSSAIYRPDIEQIKGNFVNGSTSYTALTGDPFIGQPLTVRFRGIDSVQTDFDDARLTIVGTAAAPEPGTLALLLPVAVGVFVRRRSYRSPDGTRRRN